MPNNKIAIIAGLLLSSFNVAATQLHSPVEHVDVIATNLTNLSIQNASNEVVSVNIYGELFKIEPASGILFNCASYTNLEIKFAAKDHDFFDVPCQSRVVINKEFMIKDLGAKL